MTWLTATGQLASHLRALVTTPQELAPAERGAPAAGTVAVLDLVQRVHGELVAASDDRSRNQIDDVGAYEMWQQRFDRAAAGPATHHLRNLAAADAGQPLSPTGELWRKAARSAAIAGAEWEASTRDSRPTGVQTGPAFADLASLTWAASTAFVNATGPLRSIVPRSDARALTAAAADARHAAQIARRAVQGFTLGNRDVPSYEDLREHQFHVPVAVTGPENLAPAMKRLAYLVTSADTMGPRIVAQITALHRITTTHLGDATVRAARARQHDGLSKLGAALGAHAQALDISPPHVESLRTLDPIDSTQTMALRQATAIARAAEDAGTMSSESAGHLLRAVAEVPAVTISTAERTRNQIISGQWLRPARAAHRSATPPHGEGVRSAKTGPLTREWQPASALDDLPLATELEQAANDAHHLRADLPRRTPRTARDILASIAARSSRSGITTTPKPGPSL